MQRVPFAEADGVLRGRAEDQARTARGSLRCVGVGAGDQACAASGRPTGMYPSWVATDAVFSWKCGARSTSVPER
jgi:hypothetical protein